MAEVLSDVHVEFGGVDLSEHFKSISIPASAATQTSTAFGDEWEDMEPGLKSYTVSLDFNQDFTAGGLDAILWPLFGTKIDVVGAAARRGEGSGQPGVLREWHLQLVSHSRQRGRRAGGRGDHAHGRRCPRQDDDSSVRRALHRLREIDATRLAIYVSVHHPWQEGVRVRSMHLLG